MAPASAVDALLDRADAARADGLGDDATALYDEAIALARGDGDEGLWARAALRAAASQVFGADPGTIPVVLHEVYVSATDPTTRARLAAALARSWSYAGELARARPFGEEAARLAEESTDPAVVADCLDAALVTHWGPDDPARRRELAVRLGDVAAHLPEPDDRLRAHLWAFEVACGALDLPSVHRHLRAVERLGAQSARARFFGATRRAMVEMLLGRFDRLAMLRETAQEAMQDSGLADAWMVVAGLDGYSGWMLGDVDACTTVAETIEAFAIEEGLPGVQAEAAVIWLGAGRVDRAAAMLSPIVGSPLAGLAKDVNWLHTMQLALEVALVVGDEEAIAQVTGLLGPYEDRAVFNSGAVMFHGMTDDPLSRAYAVLGEPEAARQCRERALRTYGRIGAVWWRERLEAQGPAGIVGVDDRWTFAPQPGGTWLVGARGRSTAVPSMRGLSHVHRLLSHPGADIGVLDLAGAPGGTTDSGDLGPVLDERARRAYAARLTELESEIEQARDWADDGRLALLVAERDALVDQLAAATGLGGRPRTAGSDHERARVTVRKAIVAALDRLDVVDDELARHLRDRIRTGSVCRYEPDPDHFVTWVLDAVRR